MNTQSIEFDNIEEDSSLPDVVRKSFRVPVEDSKKVWVVIHNRRYPVRDICLGGIGIILEDNTVFAIEQTLKNCELYIYNTSIKDLNGRVIHFSSNLEKELQCGIQWIDMKESTASQISKIVLKMKEQLLKDDGISFG